MRMLTFDLDRGREIHLGENQKLVLSVEWMQDGESFVTGHVAEFDVPAQPGAIITRFNIDVREREAQEWQREERSQTGSASGDGP